MYRSPKTISRAIRKLLPALRADLAAFLKTEKNSELAKFKNSLRDPVDFAHGPAANSKPFSTVLTDLARERKLARRENLHAFQCPMSPILGSARWLSRTAEIKNPFFGSAMPECGDELDQSSQP